MTTCFSSFNSNDLDEYMMNAGDEQDFVYTVYDDTGSLLDITSATCSVVIFRYGDPSNVVVTLDGTVSPSETGVFTATFSSEDSIDLSGAYQQQAVIVDALGRVHIPSRGKLIIFPSPALA